jgi:hypothetical protein
MHPGRLQADNYATYIARMVMQSHLSLKTCVASRRHAKFCK